MARVGVTPGQHLSRRNDQEGGNDQNLPSILFVSTTLPRERQVEKDPKMIFFILESLGPRGLDLWTDTAMACHECKVHLLLPEL